MVRVVKNKKVSETESPARPSSPLPPSPSPPEVTTPKKKPSRHEKPAPVQEQPDTEEEDSTQPPSPDKNAESEPETDECIVEIVLMQKHIKDAYPENKKALQGLNKRLTNIMKLHKKVLKEAKKQKKKSNSESKKNTGFNRPTHVTKEMAHFLKIKPDEKICRTDIIKKVYDYYNSLGLSSEKKRVLNFDKPLKDLFGPPVYVFNEKDPSQKEVCYSFFNLNKYVSHHILNDKDFETQQVK